MKLLRRRWTRRERRLIIIWSLPINVVFLLLSFIPILFGSYIFLGCMTWMALFTVLVVRKCVNEATDERARALEFIRDHQQYCFRDKVEIYTEGNVKETSQW